MLWARTLLFALIFVGTSLVLVPRWIVQSGGGIHVAQGAARYVGAALLAVGIALMLWCWTEFVQRGRGTPAPFDPPRRLVVRGPYRWVRNPMYIAAGLVLLGQAMLFASPRLVLYAGIFWLAAHSFVVGYEERTLARRFGADYAAYRAAVARWIPRRLKPFDT
jgi:protein-S-isoprenylcysteine O-methyltransferase Ste14